MKSWFDEAARLTQEPLLIIGQFELTLGKLAGLAILLLAAQGLVWGIDRGLRRLSHPDRHVSLSPSGSYALSRILRYLVWMIIGFIAMDYLGINLSSLAIVGGAIGVGIGFGLQNIFSNFISGIILLLEQTLKVGDFVDLQSGVAGRVSEIGIRFTRITTNDSVDVIVPNAEFVNGRVTNWTFNNTLRRIHVPFGVAYGSDKNLVREAGLAAATAVPGTVTDQEHPIEVWLVGFGESCLDFELVVWVGRDLVMSPARTLALYLWELESALTLRNLEIPFPQRDLHIRSGILQIEDRQGRKPDPS